MQLSLTDEQLIIHLDWYERLLAFHAGAMIEVPVAAITHVGIERPAFTWRTIRAPGTALPGVIAAGTFYTPTGREFWYITRDRDYLVLDTPGEYYKRLVLTLDDHLIWAERLQRP
jgi:hypothetical protein